MRRSAAAEELKEVGSELGRIHGRRLMSHNSASESDDSFSGSVFMGEEERGIRRVNTR